MLDFFKVSTRSTKRGLIEVYPKFIIKKSSDLMIRGGDFYAIWLEDKGLWSTEEQDAIDLIDRELDRYAEEHANEFDGHVKVLHLWDSDTDMIAKWHKYCQKHLRTNFHQLDEKVIFSNDDVTKKDYASKKLSYPLEKGNIDSYERLISVLYSPEERKKIEWAIGSVIAGDSKRIQKFFVFYGSSGTGKSTILNIIQQLFEGYYSTFDAKALGSSSNAFALESFKSNPLVAIQHDGDLSRIEDNTRLNSLVSHESMTVNAKFEKLYSQRFNSLLLMGTNKPVRITDAKSGLIRRLIDVTPTGNLVSQREYKTLTKNISFELGAIAYHCLKVYEEDPNLYDNYIPVSMIEASNDFYNYVLDNYYIFKSEDSITLKFAWEKYKSYCDEAKVLYPLIQRNFKEELKSYFEKFEDRAVLEDGTRVRSLYSGFKTEPFKKAIKNNGKTEDYILKLNCTKSVFDKDCSDLPAQYAKEDGTPKVKWADVTTTLSDIDTSQLHYVKVPSNHIVIDFDIPDENGNKSLEKNLEAAAKWPPTYAEFSKSGCGVHLHYIYLGDLSNVARLYDDHIEIKIFNGKASLRRKLTKCNNLPIATISSGLPLKEERSDMVSLDKVKSERGLRNLIKRNLNKEIHPYTKPSMDFIYKILEDAYESDLVYDVSDMYQSILAFAANSSNNNEYCVKLLGKMKLKSKAEVDNKEYPAGQIIFYDVEVFPNLFLVNWKAAGEGVPVVRMINPTSKEIEELIRYKLVGFNCRRYDNHILYARLMNYTNRQLYNLSKKIISGDKTAFFGEAYNLSYTDVYDFSSKKQSLKKFEIELNIHHQELGLPWDQPVAEELWQKVAEYCDNDVIATEAVFNNRKADFIAREILADVAGMTVNDTTNSLTTRIIFGKNRSPQDQFEYRNMGDVKKNKNYIIHPLVDPSDEDSKYSIFDENGRPMFPDYIFDAGKSTYRGEEVGEGGYVYSEPGMYGNVALLDIASMHPSSIVAENLFGDEYTQRFKEILDARIAIKHKDFDTARKMLGGKLAKYLTDTESAKGLADALKIAINSVYGLTAAHFTNAFRDPRNRDNIVAKRGALFMINLKHEVQKRGFKVAHIKTDSIKIPDATKEIISFVMDYGKEYGYTFEHEATYDRMCLVNDAVYIAKYSDGSHEFKLSTNEKLQTPWTATGTQFQVPYVFKTLFSHDPIKFEDMRETKEVKKGELYLDMNESLKDPDQHHYEYVGRIGSFCPIKEGCGGGLLYRVQDGKYYAATGTKGYRWLESEKVKNLGKEDCIDEDYYKTLVTEAAQTIISYGDLNWFVSDKPYKKPKYVDGKPVYPDPTPFMNKPED